MMYDDDGPEKATKGLWNTHAIGAVVTERVVGEERRARQDRN